MLGVNPALADLINHCQGCISIIHAAPYSHVITGKCMSSAGWSTNTLCTLHEYVMQSVHSLPHPCPRMARVVSTHLEECALTCSVAKSYTPPYVLTLHSRSPSVRNSLGPVRKWWSHLGPKLPGMMQSALHS
jgi:hypothetical protein